MVKTARQTNIQARSIISERPRIKSIRGKVRYAGAKPKAKWLATGLIGHVCRAFAILDGDLSAAFTQKLLPGFDDVFAIR